MKVKDQALLETARKYGIAPDSLKAKVFCLLDQGYSRAEVRFLLRAYKDPKRPSLFSGTVAKHNHLWKQSQSV